MALPFRRRIFVVLVVMTVVPTVLAVAGWVLSIRRLLPAAGAAASPGGAAEPAACWPGGGVRWPSPGPGRGWWHHIFAECPPRGVWPGPAARFLRISKAGLA